MSEVSPLRDQLEKAELDDRGYRITWLKNRLEVLLVHDPNTDWASASASVNAGSFWDYDNLHGTAHAVEHMLFMGSKKYPQENAYDKFVTAHSGFTNAWTAATETNFYFQVAASGELAPESGSQADAESAQPDKSPFYGALDRFAQFFIAPLFLQSSMDRELNAIDSEHMKNLRTDYWRLSQLRQSLSNPDHPFFRFSTGSLTTLRDDPQDRGIDVRSEIMKFYGSHYSANRMKLVILGRESLDRLEKWAVELFSEIENKNLAQNRWDGIPLFTADQLCMQVFAEPVMDYRSLSIEFPFLDEEGLYDTLPSRYISHLISYGGPGSILSYLKANGWATDTSSYATSVCPGSAFFSISVTLTESGVINYQEIVKAIFHYIGLITQRAPDDRVFNEMKDLAEMRFQFKPRTAACSFARQLSSAMQNKHLPRKWLLRHGLPRKYNAEIITKALSYLRTDNFRLTVVTQQPPCRWDSKEKWYGTKYKEEKIPESFLKELAIALASSSSSKIQGLHLPHENEFIPHDLSVTKIEVARPATSPELIRCNDRTRAWYKKDDRFWVPKGSFHVILRTPLNWTPANCIKAELYCCLVMDDLIEELYDAWLAGSNYNVSVHEVGLEFSISGYNETLPVLLEKVISKMRNLPIDLERFKIIKERLTRAYRNMEYEQPYDQVTGLLRCLNEEKIWTNDQYAAEIEDIEAEDIRVFFPQLFRNNHIELLAHGNLLREEVLAMTDTIENILHSRPLPQSQWHLRRDIILLPGNYIYERQLTDSPNVNNCIQYYLRVGSIDDDTLRAKLLLLQQIAKEPAFTQLRAKEQLGYAVRSGIHYSATTMGYFLLIQSTRPAWYLEARIESFLKSIEQTLDKMLDEDFETQKHSVINRSMAKVENLHKETMSFWEHIQSEDFQFSRHEAEATLIKNLTQADLLDFYHQYINPMSKTRMKLSIHLTAVDESTEELETALTSEPIYIDDIGQFKANLPVGPGPVSFMPVEAFMPLSH